MAMKKTPRAGLSTSGKYYRDNPAAAKRKAATDAVINKRPSQVKKRVEAGLARRKAKAAGKNVTGMDASHTKNGIVFKKTSVNRGSKKDSTGDKRARGSTKRKK